MKQKTINEFETDLRAEKINYFLASASFEERCFGICQYLGQFDLQKVLLFSTIDFDSRIEKNRRKMSTFFLQNGTEIVNVDLKINVPQFSFKNISDSCKDLFVGAPKILLLDITTFTHECLLILFRILMSYKRTEDKILLSYVSAGAYSSDTDNNEEKWLTKGVKELRSILGYPGYSDPSKKNLLVVLFGFEKERTIKLIEAFDFEKVSLSFGSKLGSINNTHQIINEERHREILELFSNADKFELSLTDPYLAKEQILEYVSNFQDYNIVIVPMNNKISTVGAGLAALENPDIQLFYMQANIYNIEAYSVLGDSYYLFNLI